MPKLRMTLSFRIPPYKHPRNEWRQKIHRRAVEAAHDRGIPLKRIKKLPAVAVNARLYLDKNAEEMNDVDNRLKDILDALQGHAGGPKGRKGKKRRLRPKIIENDKVVRQVLIRKSRTPNSRLGDGGNVTLRPFKS
jgi:hypothetical protein